MLFPPSPVLVRVTSLLVLLSALSTEARAQESPPSDAPEKQEAKDTQAMVAAITAQLTERRGLQFEEPVEVERLASDAFRAALRTQHLELKTEAYFQATPSAFRLLGLLPEGFSGDFLEQILDASASSYFGLYSPTCKAILIPELVDHPIERMAGAEAHRREVLTHELQHAAQDCRWPLASMIGPSAASHDERLARSALIEGDAVCTAFDVTLSATGSSIFEFEGELADTIRNQLELTALLQSGEGRGLVDPTARVFEYGQGAALVQRILKAGGWKAVNAAFDDPPSSSEQVLHPTKYLDERDWPVTAVLELPAELAEQGWEVAGSDTLGELVLRELFAESLEGAELVRASFGWDGDRWILVRRGDDEALIWTSVWDSRTNARQAFDALTQVYGLGGPRREPWRSSLDSAAQPMVLMRDGDRVAMCVGLAFDGAELEAAEGPAWRAVKGALSSPLEHHVADEDKGRGDARVTRRLEREAIDALAAARIQVDGLKVRLPKLDLELTLPGPSWTVQRDTPMAMVRVIFLSANPSINFNVSVAPAEGLGPQETMEATLQFLDSTFGNMKVEVEEVRDDPRGPTFELRYAADVGPNRCWFRQLGIQRGDLFIVLSCTRIGGPIEGKAAEEFELLLNSAAFGDPGK